MKILLAAVALAFVGNVVAAEPVYVKTTPNPVVAQDANDKCVKKDKNGKCPALPNSPKPTPKKSVK